MKPRCVAHINRYSHFCLVVLYAHINGPSSTVYAINTPPVWMKSHNGQTYWKLLWNRIHSGVLRNRTIARMCVVQDRRSIWRTYVDMGTIDACLTRSLTFSAQAPQSPYAQTSFVNSWRELPFLARIFLNLWPCLIGVCVLLILNGNQIETICTLNELSHWIMMLAILPNTFLIFFFV